MERARIWVPWAGQAVRSEKPSVERRRTKRGSCLLPCSFKQGRRRVDARILDVSEGGLCLLSPISLKAGQTLDISIVIPGTGIARIHSRVWHVRTDKARRSRGEVWIVGAILTDSDLAYRKLLRAAGALPSTEDASPDVVPEPVRSEIVKTVDETTPTRDLSNEDSDERVFRLRCKRAGEPRTLILTVSARSKDHAEDMAIRDLGSDWVVLDVLES